MAFESLTTLPPPDIKCSSSATGQVKSPKWGYICFKAVRLLPTLLTLPLLKHGNLLSLMSCVDFSLITTQSDPLHLLSK